MLYQTNLGLINYKFSVGTVTLSTNADAYADMSKITTLIIPTQTTQTDCAISKSKFLDDS